MVLLSNWWHIFSWCFYVVTVETLEHIIAKLTHSYKHSHKDMFWYDIEPGCFGCCRSFVFIFFLSMKTKFELNPVHSLSWEQNKLISIISSLLHYCTIIQKSIKLFGNKLLLLVKSIGKFDRIFDFVWANQSNPSSEFWF